jgi:PAS domain S-box-containing protein
METYPPIPEPILESWQNLVDTLAGIAKVPAALILKMEASVLEVVCASRSPNNPWKPGDRMDISGLFSEAVVTTSKRLVVSDARNDPRWAKTLEREHRMVAYMGLPLLQSGGEIFGALCILDDVPHTFDRSVSGAMAGFKELIETHLLSLGETGHELENLQDVLDNLAEGIIAHDRQRRISFFNRAAEKITGYSRKEIIGKDCHEVFGGPFCGSRCSFCDNSPKSIDNLYYPLNILTKNGEPRRIEMAVGARKDAAGNLAGIIASFRDVTDILGLKIKLGDLEGFAGLVGRDRKMLRVYNQIRELGTNDYPVHISGETGTGKELAARAIHDESRRGGGPFVPVNCAALPEGVLESELFGHRKGAFTGAERSRKGRFELAHRGTLFLDEVADLPGAIQAKLLRVLQEGTFERVGDEKTTTVDVRIISASNKDLKREVEKGHFRQDLFYRINVVPIDMPPLRERKGDLPLLVDHFLKETRKEGQFPPALSKEALNAMIGYSWPGNVRELQSSLRFALVKSRGRIIRADHLPEELQHWHMKRPKPGPSKKLEADTVRAALEKTGGNKAKAARALGVGRATLYRFLAEHTDVS